MTLDLSLLPDGGVPWLAASGEHSDIVLSSRIRFARNVAGFAFTARRSGSQTTTTDDVNTKPRRTTKTDDDPQN